MAAPSGAGIARPEPAATVEACAVHPVARTKAPMPPIVASSDASVRTIFATLNAPMPVREPAVTRTGPRQHRGRARPRHRSRPHGRCTGDALHVPSCTQQHLLPSDCSEQASASVADVSRGAAAASALVVAEARRRRYQARQPARLASRGSLRESPTRATVRHGRLPRAGGAAPSHDPRRASSLSSCATPTLANLTTFSCYGQPTRDTATCADRVGNAGWRAEQERDPTRWRHAVRPCWPSADSLDTERIGACRW